ERVNGSRAGAGSPTLLWLPVPRLGVWWEPALLALCSVEPRGPPGPGHLSPRCRAARRLRGGTFAIALPTTLAIWSTGVQPHRGAAMPRSLPPHRWANRPPPAATVTRRPASERHTPSPRWPSWPPRPPCPAPPRATHFSTTASAHPPRWPTALPSGPLAT